MKTISNIFSFKEERIEEEEGIRYEYATRGCSEQASKNSSSSIVTSSWPLCCVEMDSVESVSSVRAKSSQERVEENLFHFLD